MLMHRVGSDHPPPRLGPAADLQFPRALDAVALSLGNPMDCCVASLPFTVSWSLLSPPVPDCGSLFYFLHSVALGI